MKMRGDARRQLSLLAILESPEEIVPAWTDRNSIETISPEAFARRHSLSQRSVARLVDLQVLHRFPDGSVGAPANTDLPEIFDLWSRSVGEPVHRRDLKAYVLAMKLCRVSKPVMPSDRFLLAAGKIFLEAHDAISVEEIGAWFAISRKTAKSWAGRIMELLGGASSERNGFGTRIPLSMDTIVRRCPPLRHASETCLDEDALEHHEEPGRASRARLAAMGPFFGSASLFAIIASASMRREEQVAYRLRMLQRFVEVFSELYPEADHLDHAAITGTLDHIAFCEEATQFSPGVRDEICRTYILMREATSRYVLTSDPDGSKGLLQFVPAGHSTPTEFSRLLRDKFAYLREEARERRKDKSDRLADRLTDVSCALWQRMEQLEMIAAEAEMASQELLAPNRTDRKPFVEFLIEIPVLLDNGRSVPGHVQEERWRAWREDDLLMSLGLPPAHHTLQRTFDLDGQKREAIGQDDHGSNQRVYFERMGARSTSGDSVVRPFFVTLSDHGALAKPTGMGRRMLSRRSTLARTWKLPQRISTPMALLWFDAPAETIWKEARARNRSVVPLREIETAARFAELGCNAVLESMCRGGAFMQMEENSDAWPVADAGGEHASLCFSAIEKTAGGAEPQFSMLPVCDQTLLDALELAQRAARSVGRQRVPDVLIECRYRWKRPNPRPYVFQWNGKALTLAQISYFLRILLANVADNTFHDFRHASAAELFDLTECGKIVQRALGQSSGIWRYYARLTPRMLSRKRRKREVERTARVADQSEERSIAA